MKIKNRPCFDGLLETGPLSYSINLNTLEKSRCLLEYIVAPATIDTKLLPLHVAYHTAQNTTNELIIFMEYQVNDKWPNSIEEVQFQVKLNDPAAKLLSITEKGVLEAGSVNWSIPRLAHSQAGMLEAHIQSTATSIVDHIKVTFKSREELVSKLNGWLDHEGERKYAAKRLMIETIISPNAV